MKRHLLTFALCLAGFLVPTFHARGEIIDSGTCGENITWTIDDNGLLAISGSGEMYSWSPSETPWNSYSTSIESVVVNGDITKIGDNAFRGCTNLSSITMPNDLTSIGHEAFSECTSLLNISIPSTVSNIGIGAFNHCSSLSSISIPDAVSIINNYAFYYCSNLSSVSMGNDITSIGYAAFGYCTNLESVTIPNEVTSIDNNAFEYCSKLASIALPDGLTTINNHVFDHCSNLSTVLMGDDVTSIGDYAFNYCSKLTSITVPNNVASIGIRAFGECDRLTMINMLPTSVPSLGEYNSLNLAVIIVPDASLDAYKSANNWGSFANQILSNAVQTDYDVNLTALDDRSALEAEITDPLLSNVVKLKVSGTINGYDIMVIRNKMINLHELDLGDAVIVENPYKYYMDYSTQNDRLGEYFFYGMIRLTKISLPSTITSIGTRAVGNCISLTDITIPENVTEIEEYSFSSCNDLISVTLPKQLTKIGANAFQSCASLSSIIIPDKVETIEWNAFEGCYKLTSITIPNNINSIGNYAFNGPTLSAVYIKVVEPIPMGQYTFGENTFRNATLYIPRNEEWDATYWKYYYDTQWSQFAHLDEWDPTFSGFNIDNDYNLDGGTIQGESEVDENGDLVLDEHGQQKVRHPRGNFHAGSGFMVDNTGHQHLRSGHLHHDGSKCGSLIGNHRQWNDEDQHEEEANLIIDTLYCEIEVTGNRWYFLSFPFDVDLSKVTAPGNYVWREYDGESRATNSSASGNWKSATGSVLHAGKGYIFHCNKAGTLSIPIFNPDFANEAPIQLELHNCGNAQNANWNFVGNPYTSYYELEDVTFNAPITVWNGSSYEAIRPGDDDYTFSPFEAYFVQQPNAQTTEVGHDRGKRETHGQSKEKAKKAAERRAMQQVNPDRLIVNLTISDGENTDKTRIVYNDTHAMGYELDCDASKFISTEAVPQIYTTYQGVNYSINERPKGSYETQLGIKCPADGVYTIAVTRMDVPLLLEDHLTGNTHDLTLGSYSFSAEAGYSPERFSVRINSEETGIADFLAETGVSVFASEGAINLTGINGNAVRIFAANGQQVTEMVADGLVSVPTGTYLVQAGNNTTKVIVK